MSRYDSTASPLLLLCRDCSAPDDNIVVPWDDTDGHDLWHATGHYHPLAAPRIAALIAA